MNATQARIHMLFVMPLFNKYMRIVYQQFHNMSQGYFIFNNFYMKVYKLRDILVYSEISKKLDTCTVIKVPHT